MTLNDADGPRNSGTQSEGFVLVSLYSWTCITLGIVLARLVIGAMHKVGFGSDDGSAVAASVVYLGTTVSWQVAASAGIGTHFVELSADAASRFFKAAFAAQLLEIAAMALAKASCVLLIERVSPQSRKEKMFLFGMVLVYFVYATLAFSLQCSLPRPWEIRTKKCANGGPMVSAIVLNMMTDIVLAGWMLPVIRPLNMDRERRNTAAILFGTRLVVPVAAGFQAWSVVRVMRSDDPTRDSIWLAILSQTTTSLSLILASLPRVKRFLGEGGTGMMDPRIRENELVQTISNARSSRSREPLKLVPTGAGKFTTTVVSDSTSNTKTTKSKAKGQQDWQKFMSMGSQADDDTSTSSLVEQQGVTLQREVTVQVEGGSSPESRPGTVRTGTL